MKRSRSFSHRTFGALALAGIGLPLALASGSGCQTQTVPTAVRALERSGRVSFLCLSAPGLGTSPALPFERCGGTRFETPEDYGVSPDGVTTRPHLYALVTQTTRGEVAVVDMSTKADAVLDSNPRVPGANFLPVGAQPVDIASTSGSMAAFVGVAEHGREGIFALAAKDIRVCDTCAPKTLTSWPACALPAAPGEMLVVYDPKNDADEVRARCDDTTYALPRAPEPDGAGGFLVDLTQEGFGRPKLVVTIPDLGALAVIDAQTLFDVEREADGTPRRNEAGEAVYVHAPGSWKECPIDRWVPLTVDLPVQSPPAPPPTGAACVAPPVVAPAPAQTHEPRPAGLTLSEKRLFVGDLDAPVVHVLDMATPCDPIERDPLLPTSIQEPKRVVTTSQLAASPTLAGSLDRFLYAVDDRDGSVMVFDIAEDATSRRPLTRPHPEWAPAQAPDRVEFGVPVQDLVIIERDTPQPIPATGVAPEGIRCNPDPDLTVCTTDATACDPETLYRTSANYDRGAGPTRMRGAFAYVVLGTGQVAVVDIDDYDASCRAPTQYTYLYGCPPPGAPAGLDDEERLASSGEVSCNVVVPHTPRSANFLRTSERTGQNQPGITGFPLLYDNQGTLEANFEPEGPVLRATVPAPADPSVVIPVEHFTLAIGGVLRAIDQKTGLAMNAGELEHTVAMNFEDPRAHSTSQTFTITYEGTLPGFVGKAGRLDLTGGASATLSDAASRFCDQGVLGQRAWEEILTSEGNASPAAKAQELADYVQIASSIPEEDDIHWTSPETQGVCTFQQCKSTFGPAELPREARDLTILEAYQDRLELGASRGGASPEVIECCFPTLVGFNVRVGSQWAVVGNATGFLHHVIAAPESVGETPLGACRNSCDPTRARLNGRVRAAKHGEVVKDGDALAFMNPYFRIAINDPAPDNEYDANPDSDTVNGPPRDTFFQFATQGNFRPLLLNLAANTTEIQPQAITFVPSTGELAITDGSLEGLILLSAGRLDVTRQYY